MNPDGLCMGILLNEDTMEISTLDRGHTQRITLPATEQGLTALKARLRTLGRPIRLAICGSTALALALSLSQMPLQDVYIVSPSVASQSVALAHYAGRAI
jgi:hypothetical protein